MGVCWYCYWGWPKPVADIYKQASAKLDGWNEGLDFGPGHIVWSDENFNDSAIDRCIAKCDNPQTAIEYPLDQIEVTRWSLTALKAIPAAVRDCEPEEYDGEHPENYPPPVTVEMVRKT